MPEKRDARGDAQARERPRRARPLWSGTVAFGLVTLPVELYPAVRRARVSLRMVDEGGTPLARRYYSAEGRALDGDDIVRGYPQGDDRFVVVEDEELEALAPQKSREIDLSRFVDVGEIDPAYFERGYFLAPDRGALKAYRLLAKSMEDAGRAGIATFVMRDKEYLVAIIAEGGILRAETLRFHDEIRSPADVGLPDADELVAEPGRIEAMARAIEGLASETLDRSLLRDDATRRLLEIVHAKLDAGEDVVDLPADADESAADEVDLMQVLKESLARADEEPGEDGAPRGREGLLELTKAELYEQAQALDVPGRSSMTKEALADAIVRTEG